MLKCLRGYLIRINIIAIKKGLSSLSHPIMKYRRGYSTKKKRSIREGVGSKLQRKSLANH